MSTKQLITDTFKDALSYDAIKDWTIYRESLEGGDTFFEIMLNELDEDGYAIECNVTVNHYERNNEVDFDVLITAAWNGGDEMTLTSSETSLLEKKINQLLIETLT